MNHFAVSSWAGNKSLFLLLPLPFSSHEGGLLVTTAKMGNVTQIHGPWSPNSDISGHEGVLGNNGTWPSIWVPLAPTNSFSLILSSHNIISQHPSLDLALSVLLLLLVRQVSCLCAIPNPLSRVLPVR
jgi:hypothetical protein